MFRKLYLSPLGILISVCMRVFYLWPRPLMIYGHYNRVKGKFRKHTRISSSAIRSPHSRIDIADHVWVGHYCLLDGLGGITLGEGVHIASHSTVYSHSSHNALRLLGQKYIEVPAEKRPGYIIKKVTIGDYTFIGTSCVILPGVTIGKGCIIGAGSMVNKDIPDFSVAAGNPAVVMGDTRTIDEKLLAEYKCHETYYLKSQTK